MPTATYPSDVKVYLDGKDLTKWIFGADTVTLSDVNRVFRNIDLTGHIKGPGLHTLEVTAGGGLGRVEARVEIE